MDSTRSYQGAGGRLDLTIIDALERWVVGNFRPDLTIILDLPPQEGLARARLREGRAGADPFEARDVSFHQRLRDEFLAIARREPGRCVVIDASADQGAVAERIWAAVSAKFPG
jgi:dTMP kinase